MWLADVHTAILMLETMYFAALNYTTNNCIISFFAGFALVWWLAIGESLFYRHHWRRHTGGASKWSELFSLIKRLLASMANRFGSRIWRIAQCTPSYLWALLVILQVAVRLVWMLVSVIFHRWGVMTLFT